MSTDAVAAAWRQALRIVLGQLGAVLVIAVALALGWNARAAGSALAGGCIGLAATAYLLVAMLRRRMRPGSAGIGGVFFSWLVKSLLTIGLLLVALRSKAFVPPALLAGLFASLTGYWLSLVLSRVEHADRVAGK